jgi:hypothetical protein
MGFNCSSCGACCKKVDLYTAIDQQNEDLKFPFSHKNGVCEKLNEDNTCSVYNERPLICNIGKLLDYMGVKDKESHFRRSEEACLKLQNI